MASFCMFGGYEGKLDQGIHVTVFGSAELGRPPAARRLAELQEKPAPQRQTSHCVCITIFGGVKVVWPTLATEYLALHDALRSGALTLEAWDQLTVRSEDDTCLHISAFTLFGGFERDALPSEDAELDDLATQRHLGHIPEHIVDRLMLAIGQKSPQRLTVVRQAAAAALRERP